MKLFTKVTLSVVMMLFINQLVSAQTVGKGAWMVGGAAGFDITKVDGFDDSQTQIIIDPNLGYFIADDLAIGLEIAFVSTSFGGESSSNFGLGPFVRYYVTDPIFVQANVALDLSDDGGDPTFGGRVGYSWFLNNGVAIEPALYFETGNNVTSFGLSIGVQAFANHDHGME